MAEDTDRRDEIVNAAFQEFAAKGFRGATIKSIAERAQLQSPTLIYWYFPTKEALFQAVIEARSPALQVANDPGPLLDLPPDTVLPLLARGYFATFTDAATLQMVRLILAEAVQRPELANTVGERFVTQLITFLQTYLSRQIELGQLRPHDVRSSSRAMMGMLIPQAVGLVAIPALQADGLTTEEHIATAIQIFLTGLRPATTDAAQQSPTIGESAR